MKKTLSFLLVLCMVLALSLKPSKVFAQTLTDTTVTGQQFNGNGNYIQVDISSPSGDITFDGCTFEKGAVLYLHANNQNVIIKDCIFKDPVSQSSGHIEYAGYIFNAKSVQLLNNTVSGSYRGFDIDISDSNGALTATGNKITLTKLTGDLEEKNVGIQLANHNGSTWDAANINIYNNTITNATTAIRLHESFVLASGSSNIVLGSNTLVNCHAYVGVDPDASVDIYTILNTIAKAVTTNASEVTASADVAYTVIIPTSVDFGKISPNMGTLAKLFPIQVTDALIEDDANITVSLSSEQGMVMKDKNGLGNNTLAFTLGKPSITFTQLALSDHNETVGTNVYCNTANLKAAGSYMGYMTFDISYN